MPARKLISLIALALLAGCMVSERYHEAGGRYALGTDSGGVDTGDTGGVDTGDTGGADTGDSGGADTGDSGGTETGSTDTGDTGGSADTGDSGHTGDTGSEDTVAWDPSAASLAGETGGIHCAHGSPLVLGLLPLLLVVGLSRRREEEP